MTNQTLAIASAHAADEINTPAFWDLVGAYGREMQDGTPEGHDAAMQAILEHLAAIRAADKHALWCAEVNLDGAKEHLAEVQRDLAAALTAKSTTVAPDGTRIPIPVVDTPLAREIEADALAFEAAIGEKPERAAASGYPWGWAYVAERAKAGFLAWCRGDKSQSNIIAAKSRNNQEKYDG